MTNYITVEIDDLPVEVNATEWRTNSDLVTAQVREARAKLRLPPVSNDDREPTYTDLYGDDA